MRKMMLKAVYEECPDYDATTPIRGSKQAAEAITAKTKITEEAEEVMYLITLDTRHDARTYEIIARGSLTETIIHPREIFKRALITNSFAIILAHNHPSGNPSPSQQDNALTERLKKAGEILGIKILDHLIIAPSPENGHGYYSYAENGGL